jgi:hypothetical protein
MLSLIREFLVVRTSFIVRDNSSVRNTFQPLMQKAVTLRARKRSVSQHFTHEKGSDQQHENVPDPWRVRRDCSGFCLDDSER